MSNNNITETVLIVDDTLSIVGFVQSLLEDEGFNTITADNGTQAIVMAQEYRPDLILLDVMMPDVDGYTICQQLKVDRKTKDIPVIFLSALNSTFDKIKAFKCGAMDFVTKPIQPEEMIARVKSHLTICRLNRELQLSNRDLESRIAERTRELEESNKQLVDLNVRLEKTIQELRTVKDESLNMSDRTEFLSKLSHEILNENNIIEGFAELVKLTNDPDKQAEYMDCIKDSSQNLVRVITLMQEYNDIVCGNCKVQYQSVKIGAIIESLYQSNIDKARKLGLDIIVNNENPDGFVALTDENKLYSILNHLMANSLKFSEKGIIEVGTSNSDGTIVFYVKDSGIGIGPEIIEKVYQPFVCGNKYFDMSSRGIGLGLSIVDQYVKMLGGSIWFDTSPEQGTIFYISLPINAENTTEHNKTLFADNTILVGEQDDTTFDNLNEILQSFGVKVIRAKTGKELFELFRQTLEVNMIISTLKLPMMNGSDAMKLIRKLRPDIATVAQISYFSTQDKKAFAESGCNAYIDRPANATQVREILEKYLNPK